MIAPTRGAALAAATAGLCLASCTDAPETLTRQRLPGYPLTAGEHGWQGTFPGPPQLVFGHALRLHIDTRATPDDPPILPPVSTRQAALVRSLAPQLASVLRAAEQALRENHAHDPGFPDAADLPHVWLDPAEDDGRSWALVVERSDRPGFGYHVEFKGTNLVEVWAGD